VAQGNGGALRLARALRDLREREWPDVSLTQGQLAKALSAQTNVVAATLSSWESLTNPKTPTTARLNAYARFFSTRRSLDGGPHLIALGDLDAHELDRFYELDDELLGLRGSLNESEPEPVVESRRALLAFNDAGPIVIICPEAPAEPEGRSPIRTIPTSPASTGSSGRPICRTRTRASSNGRPIRRHRESDGS
jgi:hypothetical protein